jgi:hypothetical protein
MRSTGYHRGVAEITASAGNESRVDLIRRRRAAVLAFVLVLAVLAVLLAAAGTDGPSGVVESRPLRLVEALLGIVLVGGVLRSWRTGATAPERSAWLLVALSAAAVVAVLLAFVVDPSLGGRLRGPQLTTVVQMLVAPIAVVGMLVFAPPFEHRAQAYRVVMDGAAIASSTVVLGWYIAVRPLNDALVGTGMTPGAALAYITLDAVAFAFGLLTLSRTPLPLRRIVATAAVGLALLFFADVARIIQSLPGQRGSSLLSELGWIGALSCLAASSWLPRTATRRRRAGRGG